MNQFNNLKNRNFINLKILWMIVSEFYQCENLVWNVNDSHFQCENQCENKVYSWFSLINKEYVFLAIWKTPPTQSVVSMLPFACTGAISSQCDLSGKTHPFTFCGRQKNGPLMISISIFPESVNFEHRHKV